MDRIWQSLCILPVLVLFCGCGLHQQSAGLALPLSPGVAMENPVFVPVVDREIVWNQVSDELDNYFDIEREERVRLVDNVLTEGTITTFPRLGGTILEPWRKDSTPGFEKWHSSLQTLRRRAHVRVIPTVGGYLIEVAVYKELEDRIQPEKSSAGSATLRYDDSLERYRSELDKGDRVGFGSGTLGWIPQGRDVSLEQRILSNISGRLSGLSGQVEKIPEEIFQQPPPASVSPIGSP